MKAPLSILLILLLPLQAQWRATYKGTNSRVKANNVSNFSSGKSYAYRTRNLFSRSSRSFTRNRSFFFRSYYFSPYITRSSRFNPTVSSQIYEQATSDALTQNSPNSHISDNSNTNTDAKPAIDYNTTVSQPSPNNPVILPQSFVTNVLNNVNK